MKKKRVERRTLVTVARLRKGVLVTIGVSLDYEGRPTVADRKVFEQSLSRAIVMATEAP